MDKVSPSKNDLSPVAKVYLLVTSSTYMYWVVRSCPYCGEEHHHGAGKVGDPPRLWLGGRESHCLRGYYVLVQEGTYG
jgi:hypothetical protein